MSTFRTTVQQEQSNNCPLQITVHARLLGHSHRSSSIVTVFLVVWLAS